MLNHYFFQKFKRVENSERNHLINILKHLIALSSYLTFLLSSVLIWIPTWHYIRDLSVKIARLKQAKEEAEKEVALYRSHLEAEFQKEISEV